MARLCSVCAHDDRIAINTALVAGNRSIDGLAADFELSPSAVRRHRSNHIPKTLRAAKKSEDVKEGESLTEQIHALTKRILPILEQAERSRDARGVLAAIREIRNNLAFLARAAEKTETAIELPVIQTYVAHVVAIFHEFVPSDRVQEAVQKLATLTGALEANPSARASDPEKPGSSHP